jgi:hypothetical protein
MQITSGDITQGEIALGELTLHNFATPLLHITTTSPATWQHIIKFPNQINV